MQIRKDFERYKTLAKEIESILLGIIAREQQCPYCPSNLGHHRECALRRWLREIAGFLETEQIVIDHVSTHLLGTHVMHARSITKTMLKMHDHCPACGLPTGYHRASCKLNKWLENVQDLEVAP